MIAIDTSAIIAILANEPEADACAAVLRAEEHIIMSAATLAETLIVAGRRNVAKEATDLIERLAIEVVTLTPAASRRVAQAYSLWGKGVHPAALNFGDCFSYELARENACPLLFVGEDFTRTDVQAVL